MSANANTYLPRQADQFLQITETSDALCKLDDTGPTLLLSVVFRAAQQRKRLWDESGRTRLTLTRRVATLEDK
jgi:hypothetical protein